MPNTSDDKTSICVPFILERLRDPECSRKGPLFLGVNGIQGSGKTTLVTALEKTFADRPYNLSVAAFSIDDLYLTRQDQAILARNNPLNPLLQHRGQPGTHDIDLASVLFRDLKEEKSNVLIPSYDKSAFNGLGDRKSKNSWRLVNRSGEPTVDIVIFEGWCVGFRSLPQADLQSKWRDAVKEYENGVYSGQLGRLNFSAIEAVNDKLSSYDALSDSLEAFIYLDAEDSKFAYQWRAEQEEALIRDSGAGMTSEQVTAFVNGYYPAYELYTEQLRRGIFYPLTGKQLNMTVCRDRSVKDILEL